MVITHYGVENFKVQFGDTIVALNPISKESKFKGPKFGADIAIVSLNDPDMNGVEQMIYGDKTPFAISGPGEYEIQGVFVRGFPSESSYGGKERLNTIYTISLEGMNLCFLGALKSGKLAPKTKEALDDIDVLFVPIGGEGVLPPDEAHRLAVSLEAKIIVPMHFDDVGEKNALKKFLKEEGEENGTSLDKLTLKRKDLEGKEGEIVVLAKG